MLNNSLSPLVSILVVAYNSRSTILETLDSAYNQTYKKIEIVISDDCSSDDTLIICKDWIDTHKDRFYNCQLVESSHNSGISVNCNRGISKCNGEWIKLIAGDDLLMPNCIEDNLIYVKNHPKTEILFSKMIGFVNKADGSIEEFPFIQDPNIDTIDFSLLSSREQYVALLEDKPYATTYAPTLFAKHTLMSKYPYNEFYKFLEDVPEWIKLTRHGVHIECMDKITVKYRRRGTITSPDNSFFSPLLWGSKRLFFWNELEGYLREEGLYDSYNRKRKELLKIELLSCLTKNKPTFFNKILAIVIAKFVDYVDFPKF